MVFNILTLTGEQIRAARALTRLEQTDLARLAGLSLETIKRLERIRGPVDANARTLRAIQDAFAGIGVQFNGDASGRVGILHDAGGRGREPFAQGAFPLHRLVSHSRIRQSMNENLRPTLAILHAETQILLSRLGVSGVLYVREGQLLQALEGDRDTVHAAFRTIAAYPQHHSLALIEDRPSSVRQFSEFTFCCGIFPSDPASPAADAQANSAANGLTSDAVAAVLGFARELQLAAPRNTRGTPGACTLASMCLDRTCGGGSLSSEARPALQAYRMTP